jgi:23S rRNA (cytosine1962-C5)-methyltransferase
MKTVRLEQKKEKAVLNRHPWVFSGAIQKTDPGIADGDIVSVCDSSGKHLGYGYYNSKTQIAVRMLSFGSREITPDYLTELVRAAAAKRTGNPLLRNTDSYRLVFSEGDSLPGLIVDSYGRHLVMQCLTLGMEKLKEQIVPILIDVMRPESIFERSEHEGRALEGLTPMQGQVYGTTPWDVIINENGMSFDINILTGQKTGFYLDQRDNRALVKALARRRNVLNLFSYTGGFSVAAGLGGAGRIISVDASADALAMAEKNIALNRLNAGHETVRADIFQYVREEPLTADFIILDPPALAKNRASVENACRGYKDLHLQISAKIPSGGLVLTCSCSRFISMELFQMVVFSAFADTGRKASIIGKYTQPCDHPTSIFCPETEYLKTILLFVE